MSGLEGVRDFEYGERKWEVRDFVYMRAFGSWSLKLGSGKGRGREG